jgi:16S rRNA (cytosine967-C5)-methyltransferase
MSGAYNGATSQPLARLLEQTADAVQAVRAGKSLTDVLARMPADIRPGVQALSFHTLRWLGSATVARERLVPKPPAPNVDALLVTALALLWPGEPLPYAEHTLVDQAVTAAQRRIAGRGGLHQCRAAALPARTRRPGAGGQGHRRWAPTTTRCGG